MRGLALDMLADLESGLIEKAHDRPLAHSLAGARQQVGAPVQRRDGRLPDGWILAPRLGGGQDSGDFAA